jgi:hypothetical protein
VCKLQYIELETEAARARVFLSGVVIDVSITFGAKKWLLISVDQRHGTRIDGQSCLRLQYSADQVSTYVTKITSVYICPYFMQLNCLFF